MLIETIYFFLPAYFANMAPVFVQKLNILNTPLDFGIEIKGIRIFGENKTFRGFVAGILLGTFIAYLQSFHFFSGIEIVDYSQWLAIGLLQSTGALTGDAIKSFFKRRLHIQAGKPWFPYDQLDFIIGAIVFTLLIIQIQPMMMMVAILITPFLHMTANRIGYLLKIRNAPW